MKLALAAALVLALGAVAAAPARSGGDCGRTSVAATPLDDLRTGRYHGRLKQAIAGERRSFPADAGALRHRLHAIVAVLQGRFPSLRLVYLSSRTYAGYATTSLNPEPVAYDSGFAVKWAIQDRIEGKVAGPWLGWGP